MPVCHNKRTNSLYCFHWIENIDLAIDNMLKTLKPGGKFMLVIATNLIGKLIFYLLQNSDKWA